MTSICFITPTYGGKMDTPFGGSCIKLTQTLTEMGIEHDFQLGTNESLVHRGRMAMIQSFLDETDHDFAMFLDADMQFEPDDVAKIWNLIHEDHVDVAVGVYPMKKPGESWYAAWVNGKLIKNLDKFDEPIKVDYAGTGFMAISRDALEKVRSYLQERYEIAQELVEKLDADLTPIQRRVAKAMLDGVDWRWEGPSGETTAFFMTPIYSMGDKRILESEDYNFCRIAREAGIDIWMDPSVRLIHWGQFGYGLHDT